MSARPTVCVDFDGTLASQGDRPYAAEHPGEPVAGAIAWLRSLLTWADVTIHSCRANDAGGTDAIREWMRRHGVPVERVSIAGKPKALVYVDDRALRYEGGAFPTRAEMERLTWEGR